MFKKILIVEDCETDQLLIKFSFRKYFPKVELCFESSCLSAINRFGLEEFDFILMDFTLVNIDIHPFVDVASKFNTPFAIFSGSSEDDIRHSLGEIGKDITIWSKSDMHNIHNLILDFERKLIEKNKSENH